MQPPPSYAGDWITPEQPEYPKAISRWAANAVRRAAAVAFVKHAEDVAIVLDYAQKAKLPIAVRGGGHSAAGASSVEGGIVIDLSRYLGEVKIDTEKKLAYIGGGAVWGTVDNAAIEHGLASVGGTVSHTGVGGLTLGGGFGFLTGQHGLVLDNLEQVTLVIANGKILTVNEKENADLFWAVRGAGANFGVVTEFVIRLHPQRRTVFCGPAMYLGSSLDALMEAIDNWYAKGLDEKEGLVHMMTGNKGPDGLPVHVVIFFWNGPEEEGRAHFKPFFDVGPFMDKTGELPYEAINTLQNETAAKPGKNFYMKGVFISGPPSSTGAKQILETTYEQAVELGIEIFAGVEYVPNKKILSVPEDSACHVRGDHINVVVAGSWETSVTPNGSIKNGLDKIIDVFLQGEKKIAPDTNSGYGNYIMEDPTIAGIPVAGSRVASSVLFGASYPRLQKLKKEYDPEMVFSKWSPIIPA